MSQLRYRSLVSLVTVIICCVATEVAYGQGTLTDSLVLRNPTNGRTTLLASPLVPVVSPWYLTLPGTVGTSNSLLFSTVTGDNAELSWLAPGANNTVLTISGGVPQWLAGDSWLLLGNAAVNEATQFLGTQDDRDLNLRSNNLTRIRVNQELDQGVEVFRPTSTDALYNVLTLSLNMENSGGWAVATDGTSGLLNTIDFGSAGPGGAAQTGTLFGNRTRILMNRGAGHTYNRIVGYGALWQATNTASISSLIGFLSEESALSSTHTTTNLYHFRSELNGAGTVTNLFGYSMATPSGTLNNVVAFDASNIPTGAGNRYAFRYDASGGNQPFAVSAGGNITSGTLTPLATSRILITSMAATGARAIDVDMTGTTTSSGLVVRNVGATGTDDAGVLIGSAVAGTGTAIRISGVAGFNSPNTGVDMVFSTTGINAVPRSMGAGVGVSVGVPSGNRTRIGGEFFSRASGGNALGLRADVNATAALGSFGIGGLLQTSGITGTLWPLVVTSENNNDVYLGSTLADQPSALSSVLAGTSNLNTTYLHNARISGSAVFVGSTSGTVSLAAPAVVTTHDYRLPTAQGTVGAALRIASVAGVSSQLAWTDDPVAPAPLFARRTADIAYNSNALANDAQLLLALAVSNIYEFEAMIAYDGTTSADDLQIAFTVPAGASIRWGVTGGNGVSVSPSSIDASGTAISDIPVNTTTPGNDVMIMVKGLVVMGATAGNLQLRVATTTVGKTVRLLTNSYIKASRMN